MNKHSADLANMNDDMQRKVLPCKKQTVLNSRAHRQGLTANVSREIKRDRITSVTAWFCCAVPEVKRVGSAVAVSVISTRFESGSSPISFAACKTENGELWCRYDHVDKYGQGHK